MSPALVMMLHRRWAYALYRRRLRSWRSARYLDICAEYIGYREGGRRFTVKARNVLLRCSCKCQQIRPTSVSL